MGDLNVGDINDPMVFRSSHWKRILNFQVALVDEAEIVHNENTSHKVLVFKQGSIVTMDEKLRKVIYKDSDVLMRK